jgi:hypothetical protein
VNFTFNTLTIRDDKPHESEAVDDILKFDKSLSTDLTRRLAHSLGAALEYGDVILDIPEANKDQIANLYVLDVDGTDGEQRFCDIREISPIAGAIAESFRYWARRIRVFVSAGASDRINSAGLTEREVRARVRGVLDSMEDQIPLDFMDSRRSGDACARIIGTQVTAPSGERPPAGAPPTP